MMLSLVANVGAVVKDLTPDYRRAGSLIDVLSWDIYGPPGNTSLTQIQFKYNGTTPTDMNFTQFYANSTLLGTVYQEGVVLFVPNYKILEGDMVTITMKIKIADAGQHGNLVDGYIVNYVLTYPGASGTDVVPANPAGYTIIDNLRPAVVSAWAEPDPAKDGSVKVTVLFNDTMLYDSPNVSITGLTGIYNDIGQDSYATTTYTNDTWIGTFTLNDDDEETTATISVEDGEDMATNVMVPNPSAGTFEVDTINPYVTVWGWWKLIITEADVGDWYGIALYYSEVMDTSVAPTVTFLPDVSATLTSPGGYWLDNTTYYATYGSIADADDPGTYVDFNFSDAQDLAGNPQVLFQINNAVYIDTQEPTVDDIGVSDLNITEADVGDFFYVAMNFSETMNATAPTIEFIPDVEGSGTLTFNKGVWDLGDTRYTANYTIADVDETTYGVDVTVSGAYDLYGNEDPLTEYNMFDVDTVKPTVVSATAAPDPAKDGTVTVTVVFSETMDTTTNPTVTVTGLDDSPYAVAKSSFSGDTWVGTFTLDDDEEDVTAYISVVGGKDARGNTMLDDTTAGSFEVDTINPGLFGVGFSPILITDAEVGGQFYALIVYDEPMNTSVDPTITFSPGVSTTLTFASDGWGISAGRDYYMAYYDIFDGNVEVDDVDIIYENAQDLAGNVQALVNWTGAFDIDTKNPTVTNIVVSDLNITEADAGDNFTVTVTFSEAMNTSVIPDIDFDSDVEGSGTLTFIDDEWSLGNTTYTVNYTIADINEESFGVDVNVSGAEDAVGNEDPTPVADMFDVDTVKPTVVSATAVPNPAKDELVTVTVVFSETMDTAISPTVTVTGLTGGSYTVTESSYINDTWEGTFTITDNNEEATATISVVGGKDARGNTMDPNATAGSFEVDTKNPWVTGYGTTHLIINDADAGNYVTFSIMFNQVMNTSVNPTITFNPAVSSTLSFNSSTWTTTQHYTATYLISDANVEVPDVDVVVTNGEDPVGNVQSPYTAVNSFDIDTVAPTVDDISVSDDWIKETDIPGKFYVNVTFSEAMNTSDIPSILFEPDVSSTLVNETGAWVASDTHYVFTYDIADADVVVNNINVTVGNASDAAGNPDPMTGFSLFDIDTLHKAGKPEYIDVWAEYSAPMSITLNANEVAWPKEGNYSEWNSPENALASDDQNAFLTYADAAPYEIGMVLFFENPPEALDVYEITSVKLHVEQQLISDLWAVTEDTWLFEIGSESEMPYDYEEEFYRVGTVTENELSIDITYAIYDSYDLDWEYIAEIAVAVYPEYFATPMGEWYIDNVWIEVNYVYEEEGPSITIPVGGEAKVYANVTDWFNDTVPDGTPIHFETDLGTVYPLTDTTTSGIAMTTIISTDVGTATVNVSGSIYGICEVTFMAHTLDVELSPGWNLISVPRKLENTSIEAVFEGITTITKVYTYQNGNWTGSAYDGAWDELITGHPVEDIEDGIGYWVYATEPTTVTLSLEPLGYVQVIPPDYELSMGWTMVGYTTLQLEPEMPVPVYLTNLDDKWQSLYRYSPVVGYEQAKPLDYGFDNTELGRGYWIYLNEVGVLVP